MSYSLQTRGLQHAWLPCPSLSPGVCSNSCPLSQWCYLTISSSAVPFSSCPQSFPALVFFNESTLRIRWPNYWSFSFSISPSNEHPGLISFRMDWLDLLAVQIRYQGICWFIPPMKPYLEQQLQLYSLSDKVYSNPLSFFKSHLSSAQAN